MIDVQGYVFLGAALVAGGLFAHVTRAGGGLVAGLITLGGCLRIIAAIHTRDATGSDDET